MFIKAFLQTRGWKKQYIFYPWQVNTGRLLILDFLRTARSNLKFSVRFRKILDTSEHAKQMKC